MKGILIMLLIIALIASCNSECSAPMSLVVKCTLNFKKPRCTYSIYARETNCYCTCK